MLKTIFLMAIIAFAAISLAAQTTAFTYQGKLTDAGLPADGSYDLTFALYDSQAGGSQIGTDEARENVVVTAGIFSVVLDFGSSPFTSNTGNYLAISVRPGASSGGFTLLTPRQPITSSPYAVQTLRADSAAVADNANALGGNPASSFVQNTDPRLSDERMPTAGSTHYIQNGTLQQSLSNFNISGDGTAGGTISANVVDSTNGFSISTTPVLQRSFSGGRLFVGANTGFPTANGFGVTVVGDNAGASLTAASNVALFGTNAGSALTTGSDNAFFGSGSGSATSTSTGNSFFGAGSGGNTSTGSNNSFFGKTAGSSNSTGGDNSFFGSAAGIGNSTGSRNSFFGAGTGGSTTGSDNSFFGLGSGGSTQSGEKNAFVGALSGQANTTGSENVYFGYRAGRTNATGDRNVSIGSDSGQSHTAGSGNTFIGAGATAFGTISNSTAIGAGALVSTNNTIVLGEFFGTTSVSIPGSLTVNGAFTANGQSFTNLNASNITSGTLSNARLGVVPTANGGTGVSSAGSAGNVLRSDGSIWTSGQILAADISDGSTAFIRNSAVPQAGSFNITGSGILGGSFSANSVNATTQFEIGGSRMLGAQGTNNSFVGIGSGVGNSGARNTFVGTDAGFTNTTGSDNTYLGYGATGGSLLSFATAIGSGAVANSSHTVVLGTSSETVEIPGSASVAGPVRAQQIEMLGFRVFKQQTGGNLFVGSTTGSALTSGTENSFLSINTGNITTSGIGNTFAGHSAGMGNTTGSRNSFFGYQSGVGNTQGFDNVALGSHSNISPAIANATAIGHRAMATQSNSVILGSISGVNGAANSASVGIGTTTPTEKLHVVGTTFLQGTATVTGTLNAVGLLRSTSGIFISQPSTVIITSPNGACWGITVSNAGVLSTFSTACP